jgi:hypothetical protein
MPSATSAMYGVRTSTSAAVPLGTVFGRAPAWWRSMRSRKTWISAPKMVLGPRMILKPLSCSGLWLAVIITPPSAL